MNAAKQFYAQNSQLVQNAIYLLALIVICYLVYTYLTAGAELERYVIQINMSRGVYGLPGNSGNALVPQGSTAAKNTRFCINYDDSQKPDPNFIPNPLVRIIEGSDFTISWWMYISTWDANQSGVIKPIIAITDPNVSNPVAGQNAAYVMVAFLYPNTNMLGVRLHTRGVAANELTWLTNLASNATSAATAQQTFSNTASVTPICDINDVDMQRWINFTCVVSGRVLDVYYDGKLNRSCVLPGSVVGSPAGSGNQYVNTSIAGGFNGFLNGVFFSASALTPDRIYGLYQSGPQGTTSIVRALFNQLGIKLNYNGGGSWTQYL
jgi:hypothetical protein